VNIDIISDTVCPWCFIGKRRLERALAARPEIEARIIWRPFQLNPDIPPDGLDRESYYEAKFGDRERASRVYAAIRQSGGEEGIDFAFDKIARVPSTIDSHRLIQWADSAGCQDAVVEALFRRYFLEGADIGGAEVLVEAAREAGMDADLVRELLARDADVERVKAEEISARRMGVSGVPFFIVEGKYAIAGAQDPGVFLQVFDLAAQGASEADAATAGAAESADA
jgi:predicted DsbA family dithiol-disulfide isomerase